MVDSPTTVTYRGSEPIAERQSHSQSDLITIIAENWYTCGDLGKVRSINNIILCHHTKYLVGFSFVEGVELMGDIKGLVGDPAATNTCL